FLLSTGGMVLVEVADLAVKSVSDQKLEGLVKISSKELNVDLNIQNDILIDGKVTSVIQYWEKISGKLGPLLKSGAF
ncbi:MAG: hypothetical protein U1D99_04675, partial [Candidatus Omnitrophota bacterium]|nr:hypothetical protein [Candidatus Omnitrophota bacterium]